LALSGTSGSTYSADRREGLFGAGRARRERVALEDAQGVGLDDGARLAAFVAAAFRVADEDRGEVSLALLVADRDGEPVRQRARRSECGPTRRPGEIPRIGP
jgi:hypothetical protein